MILLEHSKRKFTLFIVIFLTSYQKSLKAPKLLGNQTQDYQVITKNQQIHFNKSQKKTLTTQVVRVFIIM